ncbi:hypothetical protein MPNT_80017 [Candidatus Methylacidithermus pantelleriae]|uniref:Uncharacterized protein n=1 Tax=Candidatus Methylacidithermus pantelleriae TaxID=2744239 RepID=A0A8J2BRJ3_9BACT|nr:hypothetical protein MPNT_80017 [Candidatus Methylacidithermus pantelleriae]
MLQIYDICVKPRGIFYNVLIMRYLLF